MRIMEQPIKALVWNNNALEFIDQTALPNNFLTVTTSNYREVIDAIKILKIRGAPAIGIAAGYAAVLAAIEGKNLDGRDFSGWVNNALDEIESARSTARNLFFVTERMRSVLNTYHESLSSVKIKELTREVNRLYNEDCELCYQIGKYGSDLIGNGDNIITHCNTGMLVTAGIGTALGIVYTACCNGKKVHVYADETRPLLQGARLTTWECQQLGIPVTLMCDGAAAGLVKKGEINCAIVGADRIASNGDTANKIGTYSLALACNTHNIPFYVAAPYTTFDFALRSGDDIEIEHRNSQEVTSFHETQNAPENVDVYNPAFDVTPANFISAIITDCGIYRQPYGNWENLNKTIP